MANSSDGTNPGSKNFEQLFDEMNNLLDFVIQKIESPDQEVMKRFDQIPPDLGYKFAALENDVNAFIQLNEEIIEKSSPPGLAKKESTKHLTKGELKCLERSKKLVKKAEEIQKNNPVGDLPISAPPDTEKERKKHLKRIRRGQNWKL